MVEGIVLIIPAYNPDEKFIKFLDAIKLDGWKDIIVVNDGSKPECQRYFKEAVETYGCQLVEHYVNLGQGRAFKSAFNYFIGKYGREHIIGVVECDCDGQHIIEDVNKCAELLRDNPNRFVLGVRDFNSKGIPLRSRLGNKCTNLVFRLFCGINVADTQTGLKGIPTELVYKLVEAPGERFEYASSVLLETKKEGFEIHQFPISTIYIDGNATSHFNPLRDSIRIYSLLLKYIISPLSAFIIDIVLFTIFINVLKEQQDCYYILFSTYLAKIISCAYSFIVNKRYVFNNEGKRFGLLVKYISLCIVQASVSSMMVSLLYFALQWDEVFVKCIVDTCLFFVSFKVQQVWVFKKKKV